MESISKYVQSEGRLEVLNSPYMNFKTSSNKAFDEMFRKFIYKLALKDAEYGSLDEKGTSKGVLESIIREVEDTLNDLISKITTEEEKESFVDTMERIRICGDFGRILYENCNVSRLAETLKNEEKREYYNLIERVQYLLIRGNSLLSLENFNDYEIVILDIATELEKLESYVKNQDYPIEEIRLYQSKLDTLSKSMREKIKKEDVTNSYENCSIKTTNEKLKFECEKISGLLLYLDFDSELDDLYTLVFQAISKIENSEEFDAFINFMKDVKNAGELGKRLYDSKVLDIENLTYDKIKNVEVNNEIEEDFTSVGDNQLLNYESIDDVARTVSAAVVVCEDSKSIETLNSLLDLLYESKEKVNIMYLKNKDEKNAEYCKLIDELISKYETEKEQFESVKQNF